MNPDYNPADLQAAAVAFLESLNGKEKNAPKNGIQGPKVEGTVEDTTVTATQSQPEPEPAPAAEVTPPEPAPAPEPAPQPETPAPQAPKATTIPVQTEEPS